MAWWCSWEVEEGEFKVQDQPGLHSDFQANLSYMSLYKKETKKVSY